MNKILVVGLAMVLAAAGNGRADSTNGQSSTSSATSGSAGAYEWKRGFIGKRAFVRERRCAFTEAVR